MPEAVKRLASASRISVCVDSAEDGVMRGKFYSGYFPVPFEFFDMTDMLLQMNAVFDGLAFPRMSCELRGLSLENNRKKRMEPRANLVECHTEHELEMFKGKCATFLIRVLFRQNVTWQGEFSWLEGHCTERFRSVLELMEMMAQAIGEQKKPDNAADTVAVFSRGNK